MKMLLSLLAFLALAAFARADLVIVQKIENSSPVATEMETTAKIKGDKIRMDIGDQMSTIIDSGGRGLTTLMHSQKMAMKVPPGMMEAMKTQMEKSLGEDAGKAPDLKPTGREEKISGYACAEYTGKYRGDEVTYWVTKEIPNQDAILKSLGKLSGSADPFNGAFEGAAQFPGFPIRTMVDSASMGKVVMTVVSVKEETVPASVFEIPEGYREVSMPQMQMPGGR